MVPSDEQLVEFAKTRGFSDETAKEMVASEAFRVELEKEFEATVNKALIDTIKHGVVLPVDEPADDFCHCNAVMLPHHHTERGIE